MGLLDNLLAGVFPEPDKEAVEHAQERSAYFESLIKDLECVTAPSTPPRSADEQFVLDDSSTTVIGSAGNLLELLATVEDPGQRGDILHEIIDLIESTFDIAKRTGGSIIEARRLRSEEARRSGQKGGEANQTKSGEWKDWAARHALTLRTEQPSITAKSIADKILELPWPQAFRHRPDHRTIEKLIYSLQKADRLPRKQTPKAKSRLALFRT